jgi:hypothetical protein
VLVVSSISLPTYLHAVKPTVFLDASTKDFIINLNSDYRYLKTAYYVSTHAEVLGNPVIPKSQDIIDASRTPILLLKASRAGIPTLPYVVTDSVKQITSELGFPLVIFAVNPLCYSGFKTARNKSALYRAVKSLSMNYKFTVCAQPLKGEMISFKSIFGKSEIGGNPGRISEKVYEVFHIPICRLHVQEVGEQAYLCGLQPLKPQEISPQDVKTICNGIPVISSKGEHVVG